MVKHKILCVDDEINNLEALERLLRKKYTVLKASSGREALEVLNQDPGCEIGLIISDQRMPEMTGSEFLEKSLSSHPETVRILLTGYTDIESVIEAINNGQIFRYLTKPWEPVDLLNSVEHALEKWSLRKELQLKNQELQTALNELKTLDQAKSNFMILINHELKTPLTSLINFSQLLNETPLDADQKKYVLRIEQNTQRLKNLVDDVLFIVRGEMNQIPSQKSLFSTQQIQIFDSELKQLAEQKQQNVQLNWGHHTVYGDQQLIQQVLRRILHNAIKFGKTGGHIRGYCQSLENNKVQFTLQNEGNPISEKMVDKIFQPFFIDEEIMNHSTGTGLGLPVCQMILKIHRSGLNIKNQTDGVQTSFELGIQKSDQ